MLQNKAKVLVEDNCTLINHDIKALLENQEFDVIYVDTEFEAINLLHLKKIDVVVANSKKLVADIRKSWLKTSLPIVFISNDLESDRDVIFNFSNDFIKSPLLKEELVFRVEQTLYRCQRFQSLVDLTNRDFLTNLYNKRYFYEKGREIYQEESDIAICMIDINDFKMINDTYGHLIGDEVIKAVADVLEKNTKGKDIVARFGGDEFCVLLKDISYHDTKKLTESINNQIKNSIFNIFDKEIRFSISIGWTTQKGEFFEDMLELADRELLKAKAFKPKVKLCTECCC